MHRTITAILFAVWAACLCAPTHAQRVKPEVVEFAPEKTTVDWLLQSGYGPERLVTEGGTITCGSVKLKIQKDRASGELGFMLKKVWTPIPAKGATVEVASKAGPAHLAIYPDFAGRLHWFAADAVKTKVGELELLFIDGNLDGTFTDLNEDFIARGPRGGYAFPITEAVPLVDYTYTFNDKAGKIIANRVEFTTTGDSRKLQNALNEVRLDFGLMTATSDPEWDTACEAHCGYMKGTGKLQHFEDSKVEGYTDEGDEAARTSVITTKTTPASAIKLWLSQPLHGREMRTRWMTIGGFGFKDSYGCMRIKGFSPPEHELERGVAFPPNGADNVPLTWSVTESPDPRLEPAKEPGYPITFCGAWNDNFMPRDLKCTLQKLAGDKWVDVPAQVSYPGHDYADTMAGLKYAFVLPVETLEGSTVYRIEAQYSLEVRAEGKVISCFRTAATNNARSWDTQQQR